MRLKLTALRDQLALLIPPEVCRTLDLEAGATFNVEVEEGRIILTLTDRSREELAKASTRKMIVNHRRILEQIDD